jgi:hypothetical protein
MRPEPNTRLDTYRREHPTLGNSPPGANYGFFVVTVFGQPYAVLSSGPATETGWEHVSVSVPGCRLTPSWDVMCHVKALFWSEDETVVQYHPARVAYVNAHPGCLHLWRPTAAEFPLPPPELIA